MSSLEVERYLDALVAATRDVLGADLVGAYAAGSLALDAFDPERSDIDVALVCRSALDEGAKQVLIDRLRHDALSCPARGLELVVYRLEVSRSGTPEPGFELELNDGPAMTFRQTWRPEDRPVEDGTFWYGLDRSILHQHGRVLSGLPAAEVFGEVETTELRRLLLESLQWWMGHSGVDGAATDAVLGACRALVRWRTRIWMSKVDAGRRLIADGGAGADVVERAIAGRAGGAGPSGREARAFQRRALEEIAGSAQRLSRS